MKLGTKFKADGDKVVNQITYITARDVFVSIIVYDNIETYRYPKSVANSNFLTGRWKIINSPKH